MRDIKYATDLTYEELCAAAAEAGEKKFRADQLYGWIHKKNAFTYEEMTNLPAHFRKWMSERYPLAACEAVSERVSKIDGTRKYLFKLADGCLIESVLMSYHHGMSACVSSQVGCRMNCSFCASAIGGLTRNLTAGEILAQIYAMEAASGARVSNIVMMGTGEPLDNYDNAVSFLKMITDDRGHGVSARSITLSTCGIVPGIKRLATEGIPVSLALSLHAATDALRREIMPVAKAYSLAEIADAMKTYYAANRRRLTFEYSLIAGVNDTDECAKNLAGYVSRFQHLVNLIPVNPVRETGYQKPSAEAARAFQKKLENCGIHVTIRRGLGRDIDGACGQLRKRYLEDKGV